jgi:PAS domain S-box-containing protein
MNGKRITIPLLYIVIGILWIALSDSLMHWLSAYSSTNTITFLRSAKGLTFVIASGVILHLLINRKHNELSSREKEYRSLFEANPNPIWFYDMKTFRFIAVNDAAVAKYGYSRNEFLAMTIMDIRPMDDQEKVKASYNRMSDMLHTSGTWRHTKKDGRTIYVSINSHKTILNDQEAVMVMARDMTEKILYEQQLKAINTELKAQKIQLAKNYAHMEDTLNSITDSFCTIDRDWTITKANQNFYEITGFQGEVAGTPFSIAFPAAANNIFFEQASKAMHDRVTVKFEYYCELLTKWLRFSLFPTEEGIATYFTDITLEKQQHIKLKDALERYDLAAKATGDVMYDYDVANDLLIFNEQVAVITGCEVTDIGKTLSWWRDRVHPDDARMLIDLQENIFSSHQKYWQAEYRIMTQSGLYKYVYDQGYLLFNEEGYTTRIIGAIKDIDQIKHSAEHIALQNEKLNAVSLLNSHQVRRPVASILALSNLMKLTIDLHEKEEILGMLYSCTEELDDIIHEINQKASQN